MRRLERQATLGDVSAQASWKVARKRAMLPTSEPSYPRPVDYAAATGARYRQEFYHATQVDSRGEPVRCRVNGICKTWKRREGAFRLPVKYGLRECFYIDESNTSAGPNAWLSAPPVKED